MCSFQTSLFDDTVLIFLRSKKNEVLFWKLEVMRLLLLFVAIGLFLANKTHLKKNPKIYFALPALSCGSAIKRTAWLLSRLLSFCYYIILYYFFAKELQKISKNRTLDLSGVQIVYLLGSLSVSAKNCLCYGFFVVCAPDILNPKNWFFETTV